MKHESERSPSQEAAARRRAAAERKRRSREGMRASGVPRQDQVDAALADAFAWAIRRQLRRRTRVTDLVAGGMHVDVTTVVSRAVQRLSGHAPGDDDRSSLTRAKVIGARVVERLVADRVWWSGAWAVPYSTTPLRGVALADDDDGNPTDDHGPLMGEDDDFEDFEGDAFMDDWDAVMSHPALSGPIETDGSEIDPEVAWAAYEAGCDAFEGE